MILHPKAVEELTRLTKQYKVLPYEFALQLIQSHQELQSPKQSTSLTSPRRVIIVLEAGLVRDVFTTHPIDVAIIELADGDADQNELHRVKIEDDGETVDAYCTIEEPDILPDRANQLYEIAAKED